MCFTQEASAFFALFGFASSGVVWAVSKNAKMTQSIFYFALMETLQAVQYSFIARDLADPVCLERMNQFLTFLGYLHIMFQPYFSNRYMSAFRGALGKAKPGEDFAWIVVDRLCVVCAVLGLVRLALSPALFDQGNLDAAHMAYYESTVDWLEGPQLCTYAGSLHLAWSIPLARPTYFLASMGLHSFLMFAPVVCIGGWSEVDASFFLFLSGPVLASCFTDNPQEAASIWCFFSTAQCALGAASALLQLRAKKRHEKAKGITINDSAANKAKNKNTKKKKAP